MNLTNKEFKSWSLRQKLYPVFEIALLLALIAGALFGLRHLSKEKIETIVVEETNDPETIEDMVRRIAVPYGDDIYILAREITRAESLFQNVCNSNGCVYGIGPMQIIETTFNNNCSGDVFNAEDNIRCGVKLLEKGECDHWRPTYLEWKEKIQPLILSRVCKSI